MKFKLAFEWGKGAYIYVLCYSWCLGRTAGERKETESPSESSAFKHETPPESAHHFKHESFWREEEGATWLGGRADVLRPPPTPPHTLVKAVTQPDGVGESAAASARETQRACRPSAPLTRQAAVAMDTVNESLSSPLVWLCSAYRHGTERPLLPPFPPLYASPSPTAFFMWPIWIHYACNLFFIHFTLLTE